MFVCMLEEVGELLCEINYYYGEKLKKMIEVECMVEEEMGDILFVLICFVNLLNIDL